MEQPPPVAPVPATAAAASQTAGRTESLAIAALVVGLISPFAAMFDGVPGVIFGAVAVSLGWVARRRIRRSGGTLHGGGLALAGMIVGACGILVGLAFAVLLFGLFMAMQSGSGKGGGP